MKRIALIRNSYSFDFGGAELFPINLAKILATTDCEPFLVSAHTKTLATAQAANLTTVRSPWWSFQNFSGIKIGLFPFYIVWQMYLLIWYVVWGQKNKIDVFHPQSRDDFIAVTYAAKILRKKIIWIDHADLKNIYANNKIWYKNPVGKWVFRTSKLADKVIVESESEAKLIEVSLGRSLPTNYTVIHIGVVDSYRPLKREPGKVVLAATSRLVKAKGIGELIEAFGLVSSKSAVLKLYGEGPDGDYFKSLAADANDIEFRGHVDNVTEALQNADIFVHPTYHEGFGLSLVEAEMCSLPIIASNIGSIPEIVEDGSNGILVPVKNVAKLAEAMKTLIENADQRVKMGQASRQIYLKNFKFDKIVREKFLPLYE